MPPAITILKTLGSADSFHHLEDPGPRAEVAAFFGSISSTARNPGVLGTSPAILRISLAEMIGTARCIPRERDEVLHAGPGLRQPLEGQIGSLFATAADAGAAKRLPILGVRRADVPGAGVTG